MILGFRGVHHLDRLMKMRIKRFPLGRNRTQTQAYQRILQLLVDEFDTAAKFRFVSGARLQRTFEAVQRRQQFFYRIGQRILAKFLLLPGRALAGVFELSLKAGQAVNQRIALGSSVFEFAGRTGGRAPPAAFESSCVVVAVGRGQFVLRIQFGRVTSDFPFPLAIRFHFKL